MEELELLAVVVEGERCLNRLRGISLLEREIVIYTFLIRKITILYTRRINLSLSGFPSLLNQLLDQSLCARRDLLLLEVD